MKLTRATRAGIPATSPSRNVMNGNASVERSMSVAERRRALRARFGPGDRHVGPLLGDARAVHAEVGPLGLEPFLEAVEHHRGVPGGRRDEEAVLGEAHRDAVVDDHPVEPEHEPVADRADRRGAHPVRVHPVEERRRHRGRRPRSCRGSTRRARRPPLRTARHSRADRGVHLLPVRGEVPRSLPLADVLEHGAALHVPRVDRRRADGSSRSPRFGPGDRRVRDRARPGAARSSVPARPGRAPSSWFTIAAVTDAARSALVDRRPDVGGALHVLDRARVRRRARPRRRRPSGRAAGRRMLGVVAGGHDPAAARSRGRPSRPPAPTTSSQGGRVAVGTKDASALVVREAAADRPPQREVRVPPAATTSRSASTVVARRRPSDDRLHARRPAPSHASSARDVRAARVGAGRRSGRRRDVSAGRRARRRVAWFVVKTTARSPARTPKRST